MTTTPGRSAAAAKTPGCSLTAIRWVSPTMDSVLRALTLMVGFVIIAPASAAVAQQPNPWLHNALPGLSEVATATLNAIRQRDTAFLGRIGDSAGVTLGIDSDPIPLGEWRRDLASRGAAYCVIFDVTVCSFRADSSLRDVLGTQPVSMRFLRIDESQETRGVIIAPRGSEEEFFTLWFRRVRGQWLLKYIEYN